MASPTLSAAGRAPSAHASSRRRSLAWWTVVTVGAAGAVVGLVLVYHAASLHGSVPNSDGATVLLEGQAMAQGHVLLHGWYLSLDSFWSVDALFYAVGYLVAGLSPSLMAWVPAVIAAMVVLVGALLAADGRRRGAAVVGVATIVILLAFPSHAMATFYLRGPLHIGTTLWALVAFYGLRRARFGSGLVAAVVVLAAGMLGDLQILAYGVLPVMVVGALTLLCRQRRQEGLLLVWAATASITLAVLCRLGLDAVGGFRINRVHAISSFRQVWDNAVHFFGFVAALSGASGDEFGSGGVPRPLEIVRLAGLALLLAALVLGVAAMLRAARRRDRPLPLAGAGSGLVDDLLATAAVGSVLSFGGLSVNDNPSFARYLVPAVVFSSVLAARTVARWWERGDLARLRWPGALAGVALACVSAASLGYTLAAPAPADPALRLASYLESRGLTQGVGDYWSSNITTVDSGGKVAVRPVVTNQAGVLVRYVHQSTRSWYESQAFQFFVYDTAEPWDGVDSTSASLTWGPPQSVSAVGPYRVLVWSRPLVLSPP